MELDLETFLTKPGVIGERQAQVARSHDGDSKMAIEPKDLTQMPTQFLDVVADAANAELTEVRQILANLRRVELKLLGERFRGDRLHARPIERVQAAEVHGQSPGRELRHLIGCRTGLVPAGHKREILTRFRSYSDRTMLGT